MLLYYELRFHDFAIFGFSMLVTCVLSIFMKILLACGVVWECWSGSLFSLQIIHRLKAPLLICFRCEIIILHDNNFRYAFNLPKSISISWRYRRAYSTYWGVVSSFQIIYQKFSVLADTLLRIPLPRPWRRSPIARFNNVYLIYININHQLLLLIYIERQADIAISYHVSLISARNMTWWAILLIMSISILQANGLS